MNIAEAIDALANDTDKFLRTEQFKIKGSGTILVATSAPAIFKMEANSMGGFKANFVTQNDVQPGPDEFKAWYVPMQQLKGFTANWLPTETESTLRLMLTSQLSGCLFGTGTKGSRTCVAHIQPDQKSYSKSGLFGKKLEGTALVEKRQKVMRKKAEKQDLTPFAVLGDTYTELEYATVVGTMADDGKWTFYQQKLNSMGNTIAGLTNT
jgi:hypothetical protein